MNSQTYGTLCIVIVCTTLRYVPHRGYVSWQSRKVVQRFQGITREQAQELTNQHTSAAQSCEGNQYSYQWQADTEVIEYSTAHS